MEVIAACGSKMLCREKVQVDLDIVTAAGPLDLKSIECLVLEAPKVELLLGLILAQQNTNAAEDEADDVPCQHVEVLAIDVGFDTDCADRLRKTVIDYADVFTLQFGQDDPVDVEPLEVRLEPGP
ncbi:hypothetical protein CCR75_008486 [Bremia lactucae]|uniref:Uncharacterized protein n=1 Tax=Bremia lactucae TaxID=4779 RepID=A0A976NYA2_BRELC|nr:hypothetical protein CCR75_008486 [Bremia lactucae]